MKLFASFFIIAIIFISPFGYGQPIKDSSGVYLTREDFIKDNLSYATPNRIKEKFIGLHSDFEYQAQGVILLKEANKKIISFEPGKIYGFLNEGERFLYIPDIKKYFFVLNEEPVIILMGEETTFYRFNTHTNLLLFYLNPKNKLKRMTTENLSIDFMNETDKLQALIDIQKRFKENKNKKLNPEDFAKYINDRFTLKRS